MIVPWFRQYAVSLIILASGITAEVCLLLSRYT